MIFFGLSRSHCSRIDRNSNFIAQDFFHFPGVIHNGDTLNMLKNLRFHRGILKNFKFCPYWKKFLIYFVLKVQKWSKFKNVSRKHSRILQSMKTIYQGLQKYSKKGRFVILFSDVRKNLFYDKSCVFSKKSTWHRCVV